MITAAIDPRAAENAAHALAVARYGKVPATMSKARAVEYMRAGWSLKMGKTRVAAFEAAIASGEIKEAGRRSFSVGYDMGPGRSAGGSSIGSRPISYDVLDTASIDAWARFEVMTGK